MSSNDMHFDAAKGAFIEFSLSIEMRNVARPIVMRIVGHFSRGRVCAGKIFVFILFYITFFFFFFFGKLFMTLLNRYLLEIF
jgi:hypothetical protein